MIKKVEEVPRCFGHHNQSHRDRYYTNVEVAYNHSINFVTTYSPIYVTYGRERTVVPFETLGSPIENVPDLAEMFPILRDSLKTADDAIREANGYRAQCVSKSRRDCRLSVGDLVMLCTKCLVPEFFQGSRKLVPRYSGPYKITEAVTPATFWLDLPQAELDRKVLNAFHATSLKPHDADTIFGRFPNPPSVVTLSDGSEAHEVEHELHHVPVDVVRSDW